MRYQKNDWSCGPASVVNAFRALGHNVSELSVRKYSNSTEKNGTDEIGLLSAIRSFGFSATELKTSDKKVIISWIKDQLILGKPVIIPVHDWEHWVVIVGILGEKFIVVDSSNYKNNIKENGTYALSKKQLIYRLWNTDASKMTENDEHMYGIAIGKK